MRDGIIFLYQRDMVHIARACSSRHTCHSGNATLVIFHLERKHLPLHSTYSGSPYGAGNSNSALYIGLTLYQAGWEAGEASGYTSDKWWIGNKWGILTGNIRDIKKEPRTPRRISHIERLKSDTPVLSESNKGHVRRDMEYSRDTSARPRLNPFWGKKKRTTEYTSGIYPENLIKDPDRIR